ncbi:MAG: glycoside hydrolase family 20 zincin-like fold domain-containing protein, partial [Bacteroidota bacterium]
MTTRKLIILFYWIFIPFIIQGQSLIPAPKEIQYINGSFLFSGKANITAFNTNTFNIDNLVEAIEKQGITTKIVNNGKRSKSNIVLERADSPIHLEKILKKNKLDEKYEIENEGYVLNISTKKIQLFALTEAGIFYGVQTLKQLVSIYGKEGSIPCMLIYDKPDIAIRAWQDDISRGPIPTMDMLKEQIRTMSSFKLNYFTLYIEHVFKLKKHPEIAPKEGISKAQIEELSRFAKKYHVKLIGSYQSFGHMAKTLSHPKYQYLAENKHIISPTMKESYEFLQDVYQEIVPVFNGNYFNINCDETFGLGEGKSKVMADSMGIDGIYLYHINKLNAMLKPFDKKILMWGDIVAKYPQIIDQLPKDITVIAWAYHAADNFEFKVTPLSKTGLNVWVAPGINCWGNIFPNYQTTEINVYNFIRDGYKHNATAVLNTSWDDDGLNFFQNNWHGFAWGAENSWNAPPNLTNEASEQERHNRYMRFNKAFDAVFYGLNTPEESVTDLMIQLSSLHQSGIRNVLKNSRFFEPIFPMHFDYLQKGKREENISILHQLDTIYSELNTLYPKVRNNKQTLDYLLFAISQTQFTIKKNLFRIALYGYLNDENTTLSKDELKIEKIALVKELQSLKERYTTLWKMENRNHWLEENTKQYDKLINELTIIDGYIIFNPINEVNDQGRKINIRSVFNDFPIHYTINKDTVTTHSPQYLNPIFINKNATILARSIDKKTEFQIQKISLIHHKGIGKLQRLISNYSTYHPSYDGGGDYALLDGRLGSKDELRSGRWQGFAGEDIEIEIDLKRNEPLKSFSMGFFQNTESWVIFPRQVEIYIKDSINQEYELYSIIKGKVPPEKKGNLKENYTTTFTNIQPRYIKIIARYYGKLPEWHHAGSKYESM